MSGHSHYSTIKRAKEAKDAAKGKIFSKHSKAIAIAIKAGGNPNPEMNSKLRFAIDQAKADNMPKVNIDRILARAEEVGNLEEVTYEGYAPEGVAVVVDVATDNKNRTAQEIKNIFERGGGSLAGPGAVAFNFEQKGLIVVNKDADPDTQMLKLIDLGVTDIEDAGDLLEAYVSPQQTSMMKDKIEQAGFKVDSFELIKKPINFVTVTESDKVKKIIHLLDSLEDAEDVQNVSSNLDFPDTLVI